MDIYSRGLRFSNMRPVGTRLPTAFERLCTNTGCELTFSILPRQHHMHGKTTREHTPCTTGAEFVSIDIKLLPSPNWEFKSGLFLMPRVTARRLVQTQPFCYPPEAHGTFRI